jgi:hypothetical protein
MNQDKKVLQFVFLALAGVVVLTSLKKLLSPGQTDESGAEIQDIKNSYSMDNVTIDAIQARLIGDITYDEIGFFADFIAIKGYWQAVNTIDDVYFIIDLFGVRTNPFYSFYPGSGTLYYWLAKDGYDIVPGLNDFLDEKGINFRFASRSLNQ